MADSIKTTLLYNGSLTLKANSLEILEEPNQQLANAIATGPQDEFFSRLEECNRYCFRENPLMVTPSWNWKPGTLDKIKAYTRKQLMLDKKSSGLGKYLYRTKENASYGMTWLANKLTHCEELKRELKREGYSFNVNIDEYVEKLRSFCNNIYLSIDLASKATNGKVKFIPYVYIPENNERATTFYLCCYIEKGIMNICQGSEIMQKLPMEGIEIIFDCSLRMMMRYYEKPTHSLMRVNYKGLYDSPETPRGSYRARQLHSHPYIAQPSTPDYGTNAYENGELLWGLTCFSNYTDDVKKSFHDLDFVVLAMKLLEWSGYYNIDYSNPYNMPTHMHFGMPSKFSKTYQMSQGRQTDNCSTRLRGKLMNNDAASYSKAYLGDIKKVNDYCNEIDCVWRNDCAMYKNQSESLKSLDDENRRYELESILGSLIAELGNDYVDNNIIESEYEIYFDSPGSERLEEEGIRNYEDVLNSLICSYPNSSILSYEWLLHRIEYWGKPEPETAEVVIEDTSNEEIKKQMLQWATGRG